MNCIVKPFLIKNMFTYEKLKLVEEKSDVLKDVQAEFSNDSLIEKISLLSDDFDKSIISEKENKG